MLPFHNASLVSLPNLLCAGLLIAVSAMLARELGGTAWAGSGRAGGRHHRVLLRDPGTLCYVDAVSLLGLMSAMTFGLRSARTGRARGPAPVGPEPGPRHRSQGGLPPAGSGGGRRGALGAPRPAGSRLGARLHRRGRVFLSALLVRPQLGGRRRPHLSADGPARPHRRLCRSLRRRRLCRARSVLVAALIGGGAGGGRRLAGASVVNFGASLVALLACPVLAGAAAACPWRSPRAAAPSPTCSPRSPDRRWAPS